MIIEIGRIPVSIEFNSPSFEDSFLRRYSDFITANSRAAEFRLSVEVKPEPIRDSPWRVQFTSGRWLLERSGFRAECFPEDRWGRVELALPMLGPVDSTLRILHSILLAPEGGFLLHASSIIRNGHTCAFSGVSGAGKTTMAHLAAPPAVVLTDEISYILPMENGYRAYGTPFTSHLNPAPGTNTSAPLHAIYLLSHGAENRMSDPLPLRQAAASILRNMLLFGEDADLRKLAFETAFRVASIVPVYHLAFVPTPQIWEIIP